MVTLLGCGQQSVIKLGAAAETNVITMGDAVSNVLIDSLKVDGNRANQATQVGVGIRGSKNLENIEVRDCWVVDCKLQGIAFFGTSGNTNDGFTVPIGRRSCREKVCRN